MDAHLTSGMRAVFEFGPLDAFRTTMLRNVELTGPYGHAGQFADLEGFIDHYGESADKLRVYGVDAVPTRC